MRPPLSFAARIVPGAGRGKALGFPTFNLALDAVPNALQEGVYAVYATMQEGAPALPATMHFGPRPTFGDTKSCEVHLLERPAEGRGQGAPFDPTHLSVEVVGRLRDVRQFETPADLQRQLAEDSARARALLQ